MTLAAATSVTKTYAGTTALAETTLALNAGEFVVVRGPTGSGKTTLVNLLAGWAPPDRGTITWEGGTSPPHWETLAVIPQALALLDELTVLENILLPARANRRATARDADRAMNSLVRLGLDRLAQRRTSEISVGERQRVMVARALHGDPRVVLADEPAAHQDAQHAAAVVELLVEAVERGACCVLATRSEDFAANAHRAIRIG
jgi:putative ABC transport system ATP-binding protein